MKLSLTTWQRIVLVSIIGNLRGDVSLVWKAVKALDALQLTEEEKKEVGFEEGPAGLRWKDETRRFEIILPNAAFVQQIVREYKDWPIALASQVFDLCKQLEIEEVSEGV
jgi:hypothetical protein